MERIGNQLLDLDDIIHVLRDPNGGVAFITCSHGLIPGIVLSDEEFEILAAELGVPESRCEDEGCLCTPVHFDQAEKHFVTDGAPTQ